MPTNSVNDTSLAQQSQFHIDWLVEQDIQLSSQQCRCLADLFSMSEFARRICYQYPSVCSYIVQFSQQLREFESTDSLTIGLQSAIAQFTADVSSEVDLMRQLRIARHSLLATITYLDLIEQQPIAVSLQQVSLLADALIMAAYNWQYNQLQARYGTPHTADNQPQPLCILAMGKLGGHELNFSSDIDLIFAYPEKGETCVATDKKQRVLENQQFFTKLAQRIIFTLDTVTADGFVYRVDMRLRPFGESGPLVANFDALEDYYQQQGRDWERYAMLKARIINPPSPFHQQLTQLLRPFVYRRYVDFTALESLRSMKHMIEKEVRRKRLSDNIKLGAGGIREVEFFVQSMQIIHAGKYPLLQTSSLLEAINGLVHVDILSAAERDELLTDYYFLRKVEHCLQQVDDQQTQQLPTTVNEQARIVAMLRQTDWNALYASINAAQKRINSYFHQLMETPEEAIDKADPLYALSEDLWTVELSAEEWQQLLSPYMSSALISDLFTHCQHLSQRLTKIPMGQRGADVFNRLMPAILFDILSVPSQQYAMQQIVAILCSIAGRTAYLDLLLENPPARQQLLFLTGQSAWIGEQIARFPMLLDELLDPSYLAHRPTTIAAIRDELQSQLQQSMLRIDPDDLEAVMNAWRQFKLSQQLIIAASDVCDTLPTNAVSDHLTALAEVLLDSVIRSAWRDMSKRYGEPEGETIENAGLCVVAYGKFGGLELGYGSDLDLVFLHNANSEQNTTGVKSVSATQFYVKVVQRVMHLMATTTQLGHIYEIDLRLRPNGNSGMLCSHIESFQQYQLENAWTWEHQALVRARPVWGQSHLKQSFDKVRQKVLCLPRIDKELNQAVYEMREKMRAHLFKPSAQGVDLKQAPGGITDIEFLTQFWVLAHAHKAPELMEWPDNLRILDSAVNAGVITQQQGEQLKGAYLTMRQAIHQGALNGESAVPDTPELQQCREFVSKFYQRTFQ
ncbi:bifunctional [glutamate--ammonia ligase]-adenylyl-L-tyrosine phosphorylase/[glutamate--ammonia-ligase] adenylyltransferase [Alteromonas flava]|uniref:bifunctional [glutamate--ammonia ligase]-adenylyl-L-tyrosine phosphorylase/[glutamate--ammonia-ligase] adenylyltransferase n=1 Tax=Alteromonas flava TaxID=2048003 RepID=UPI000C28EE4E|nr:bifunctional [glutamate--ammonia ligase]-adenylyl-L-tyrosine phosphorylase/[glutamate--ammonia-ligase] adenylyltransferase [Alteromonas flava]